MFDRTDPREMFKAIFDKKSQNANLAKWFENYAMACRAAREGNENGYKLIMSQL